VKVIAKACADYRIEFNLYCLIPFKEIESVILDE